MVADPDSVAMLAAAKSQATAAWLQAWGAIAAIIAAALIASHQSRRDAKVRASDARSLARDHAMLVSRPMKEWGELARDWIKSLGAAEGMGEWSMVSLFADRGGRMFPPVEIRDQRGELRNFGSASEALQNALIAWDRLHEKHSEAQALWNYASANPGKSHEGKEDIVRLIRAYAGAVSAASRAVDELLKN